MPKDAHSFAGGEAALLFSKEEVLPCGVANLVPPGKDCLSWACREFQRLGCLSAAAKAPERQRSGTPVEERGASGKAAKAQRASEQGGGLCA